MTSVLAGAALFLLGGVLAAAVKRTWKGWAYAAAAAAAQIALLPAALKVLASGETASVSVRFSFPVGDAPLRLDPLAALFVLIVGLGGALAALYSAGYMKTGGEAGRRLSSFYLFQGALVAAMLLVATVQNALLFLIVWEIMSLSSFFLVGFDHRDEQVRQASLYYLIAMQVGAAILIAAFAWTSALSGSLDFAAFGPVLGGTGTVPSVLFLLFLLGFGTKAGFVPLHTWLPRAHPAAPTGVSALMSGVMIKTGIYGILRIVLLGGGAAPAWGYIILIAALVSGVYGVMNAIAQHDLKKLLAYHSIENIGIIGMGIGLGMIGLGRGQGAVALLGFLGAVLHVFNHFTFKTLLFFGAGNVYSRIHTREIDRMGGLVKVMPATAAMFLAGSLAICGLPLFNGFISEFAVYLGLARGFAAGGAGARVALMGGLAGLAFIGVLAVLCFTKVFGIAFLGSPRRPWAETPREASWPLLAPMGVLAALILIVGLLSPLVMPLLGPLVRSFIPGGAAAEWAGVRALFGRVSPALAVLAALILFFLALRRALLGRKPVRAFKTWDCGYQAESPRFQYTAGSFAAPFLKLVAPLVPTRPRLQPPEGLFPERASFESHGADIVDEGLVRPLLGGLRRFLGLFTWIQSGRLQNYMLYGIIFLIVLIIWILGIK